MVSVRIALTLCLLAAAAGAGTASRLDGVVRDATSAVVPDATIVVIPAGGGAERIAVTGRDGRFSVDGLADGGYTVSIIAPGFAVVSRDVTMPSAGGIEVALEPAPVIEEVRVVSAARQEQLRESLNTRVDVITRARIEDTGAQTVAEVLRELPGVVTRRGSETAGAGGEQIQGIDSRQVLVLLDGQPLAGARGIKRGVINLDRQSTARLDRIEVVKGASSALYGSDAIGGVINLITRDASAPLATSGEVSGGSFGEINAVAEADFRAGVWSGLVTAERHRHDGFVAPGFSIWDLYVSQRVVRGLVGFAAVDNLFDSQVRTPAC